MAKGSQPLVTLFPGISLYIFNQVHVHQVYRQEYIIKHIKDKSGLECLCIIFENYPDHDDCGKW